MVTEVTFDARFGGLVLTHNEVGKAIALLRRFLQISQLYGVASDSGEGAVLPTWTAVDTNNVRTQRELMENMRKDGWNVEVCLCCEPCTCIAVNCFSCSIIGTFLKATVHLRS